MAIINRVNLRLFPFQYAISAEWQIQSNLEIVNWSIVNKLALVNFVFTNARFCLFPKWAISKRVVIVNFSRFPKSLLTPGSTVYKGYKPTFFGKKVQPD